MTELNGIHTNLAAGVGFAFFAVLVGTRWSEIGLRDYIIIMVLALLSTAFAIERWFSDGTVVTCSFIGFGIGYLADDVYININATLPDVIKGIIGDGTEWLHNKVRQVLGLAPKDDDEDDE